jgi:2'-5' RNA ligase
VRAALVVPLPSVAPPIAGLPAHVTLLFPFPEPDDAVVVATRGVLGGMQAFEVAFREVRRFPPDIVYLAPEPEEPFRLLTEALVRRFPTWPPYGGTYDEVVPHLTIAADEPAPPLPARARAAEAVLFVEGEPHVWAPHTTFPFEGA